MQAYFLQKFQFSPPFFTNIKLLPELLLRFLNGQTAGWSFGAHINTIINNSTHWKWLSIHHWRKAEAGITRASQKAAIHCWRHQQIEVSFQHKSLKAKKNPKQITQKRWNQQQEEKRWYYSNGTVQSRVCFSAICMGAHRNDAGNMLREFKLVQYVSSTIIYQGYTTLGHVGAISYQQLNNEASQWHQID